MKKRFIVLLAALAALIITAVFAVPTAASDAVSVKTALELRDALRRDGNVIIEVDSDIYYKLPTDFIWEGATGDTDFRAWVKLGSGRKTLKLKSHSIEIDDDMVKYATYKTENRYDASTGTTYEELVLDEHGCKQKAVMFRIENGSSLTIYGAGGSIHMYCQLPSQSQLKDEKMIIQRDLFDVYGGTLSLIGGEYTAGRAKTVRVSKSETYVINENDEASPVGTNLLTDAASMINGTVVNARNSGFVSIVYGTFTGYGIETFKDGKIVRNAVFETDGDFSNVFILIDVKINARNGATGFSDRVPVALSVEFRTTCADYMALPDGKSREVCTVAMSRGAIKLPAGRFIGGYDSLAMQGVMGYDPDAALDVFVDLNRTLTQNSLCWYDKDGGKPQGTEQRTLDFSGRTYINYSGIPDDLGDNPGFVLADTSVVLPDECKARYMFSVMQKTESNTWKSVTPWIERKSGTVDLAELFDKWEDGAEYRVQAKYVIEWHGSHEFLMTSKAENPLYFTVRKSTPLGNVALETDLKEGTKLDKNSIKVKTPGVSITALGWYHNGAEAENAVFGEGEYFAYLTLNAGDGLIFPENPTVSLNNVKLDVVYRSPDGKFVIVKSYTITGACTHRTNGNGWEADGDEYHHKVCSTCGKEITREAHKFDSGKESGGKVTYTCSVCGYQLVKSNGKTAIYEVVSNTEPVVFGQPLPAPSIRSDYARFVTIKSYEWYKDNTKISGTSIAEKGWYSLVLNVTADDGYYFEKGAKVQNPYYSIDAVSNTEKIISTTLRTYVKEIGTAEISVPRLSPAKTLGDLLDRFTVKVEGSKNILIRRFDISWDDGDSYGSFILNRSSDGKWSADANDASGMKIDQIKQLRIEPNTEYVFEAVFTSNTYYIPDENIRFSSESYEIGHVAEGGDENCLVRFRILSDDDVIARIDIRDVAAPEPGKKPSTSCSVYDSERISIAKCSWNTSDAFECGKSYTVTVNLETAFGFIFNSSTVATVNGRDAKITFLNGTLATVEYTFSAVEHIYGDPEETAPGCETEGSSTRVCKICGYKEVTKIPPTGHSYYKVGRVPPTCVKEGVEEHYLCSNCYMCFDMNKNEKTEDAMKLPLDKTNHVGGESAGDAESHYTLCACGEKLNAEAHKFSAWNYLKLPSEQEEGERTRECSVCGYSVTEAVPKLQPGHTHDYKPKYDAEYHWTECECGASTEKEAHTFGEDGKCAVCGYEKGAPAPVQTEAQTPADTQPSEKPAENGNLLVIILLIVIAALLIAAAVVITVLALKLKKKKKEEQKPE